jgi:hypothetical protein
MKMRVEVKNRIHMLLDKHDLSYGYTDLFGKEGLEWLRNLNLPSIDQQILQSKVRKVKRSAGPKKNERQTLLHVYIGGSLGANTHERCCGPDW